MKLVCPECGSTRIDQYRQTTGAIWCQDCKYQATEKEKYNPFLVEVEVISTVPESIIEVEMTDFTIKLKENTSVSFLNKTVGKVTSIERGTRGFSVTMQIQDERIIEMLKTPFFTMNTIKALDKQKE
jgi:ABC-type molybdate transport system ATPase subunit